MSGKVKVIYLDVIDMRNVINLCNLYVSVYESLPDVFSN